MSEMGLVLLTHGTDFDCINDLGHSRMSKRAETAQSILGNRYSITVGHYVESEDTTASTTILCLRRQTVFLFHPCSASSSYSFRGIVQRPD